MEMITRRRHTNFRLNEPLLPTTVPYKQPTVPWSSVQSSPPKSGLLPQDHSCRDRTSEFFSAVKSLQSRRKSHFMPVQKNRPQKNEFALKARYIGKDLANTFCKMEKLTLLVMSEHMSGNPNEIVELTAMIKQDITGLNKNIATLEELSQTQKHHRNNHQQTHSNSIVLTLQSRLVTLSNDFKVVLQTHAENLKQQNKQQSPQLYRRTEAYPRKNFYAQDDQQELVINMDSSEPRKQQDQVLLEEQRSHYQERADTMQSIETTIVELGSVFQRLATIMKEQDEQVHRIDSNINDADLNIEAAHSELLKYFQYVSSNRWLFIKIFIVLIVFFIVFIKILA